MLYRGGGFRRSVFRATVSTATAQNFLLFRIFPIDFILTLVYNKSIKKGGDKVKKKKKKPHEIAGRCSDHRDNRNRGLSGRACVTDN